MKKNVGKADRIIRIILAVIFAYLGYVYSFWFYILTIIFLFTAFRETCLLYELLGINTIEKKK